MSLLRADAALLPLADESVDLIITSPPYFALRSYQDGGEAYEGQIGAEPTPRAFLESLWAVTAECWRVLKPTGSLFVNLGDKYAGSGGHNNDGVSAKSTLRGNGHEGGGPKLKATRRSAPDAYNKASDGVRDKSLLGLPWRYALGCVDGLADPGGVGWILRSELVWSKPNGMPEPVTDRVRRSHEQFFHLVKNGRYYSAVDELREPLATPPHAPGQSSITPDRNDGDRNARTFGDSELGRPPGSVWQIATEPLVVPAELEVDHFAAFPTEWPRRLILGWSPPGICSACKQGRRPIVESERNVDYRRVDEHRGPGAAGKNAQASASSGASGAFGRWLGGGNRFLGYVCACTPFVDHPPDGETTSGRTHAEAVAAGGYASNDFGGRYDQRPKSGTRREYLLDLWEPPETTPAVVLDPFGGTGTTAMVANALRRFGVSVDLSADYLRLARWRVFDSGHDLRTIERTWGTGASAREERRRAAAKIGVEELDLFAELGP